MPDQIFTSGPLPTPLSYKVPGTGEVVPLACEAVFDGTNASGDFVPALVFRSQAGHVISRVPTSQVVIGGDSAEVTWAPFLRASPVIHGSASWGDMHGSFTGTPVHDNVVFDVRTDAGVDLDGAGFWTEAFPIPPANLQLTKRTGVVTVSARVSWSAPFGGDRYVEIDMDGINGVNPPLGGPFRSAYSGSPEGTVMSVSGAFVCGFPTPNPAEILWTVFQNSGVDQFLQEYALVAAYWTFDPSATVAR